jgi:CBS domain-containing protein
MTSEPDDERDAFDSYFHRLNNVLPERQEVVAVGPDTTVDEALALMAREGFSQLPIVEGREVLGAFTYRSFALGVARMNRVELSDLPVFDFSERLRFARPRDDFEELIDALDRDGAVFVGDQDRLIGVATTVDVLRYLLGVANVYVLLQEIELALRELLRVASGDSGPADWMHGCLSKPDGERPAFEEMSFGDYMRILQSKAHWEKLTVAFGPRRQGVLARLRPVNELRNVAFHFRRAITPADHETLADARDWLLARIRIVDARRRGDIGE